MVRFHETRRLRKVEIRHLGRDVEGEFHVLRAGDEFQRRGVVRHPFGRGDNG